ncbi:MAG: hypothetical protein FJ149_06815 [Euryarchaeota archaeon]|nr:hypothetical protein [Euryarchaeota archaeon]
MYRPSTGRALRIAAVVVLFSTAAWALCGAADAAGPGGADIRIKHLQVQPERRVSSNGTGLFTLVATLENSGNATGTVRLALSDAGGTFFEGDIDVAPGSERTFTRDWRVNGTGEHNATATLSGENASAPLSAGATCELAYVPVEHPSPWYTIPCAFLAIIIPCIVIWLVIRRLSGAGLQRYVEKGTGDRNGREDREQRTGTEELAAGSGQRAANGREPKLPSKK